MRFQGWVWLLMMLVVAVLGGVLGFWLGAGRAVERPSVDVQQERQLQAIEDGFGL